MQHLHRYYNFVLFFIGTVGQKVMSIPVQNCNKINLRKLRFNSGTIWKLSLSILSVAVPIDTQNSWIRYKLANYLAMDEMISGSRLAWLFNLASQLGTWNMFLKCSFTWSKAALFRSGAWWRSPSSSRSRQFSLLMLAFKASAQVSFNSARSKQSVTTSSSLWSAPGSSWPLQR